MNARVTRRGFVAGGAAVAGGLVALSSVAGTTNAPVQARAEEAAEGLIASAQMNAQECAAAGEDGVPTPPISLRCFLPGSLAVSRLRTVS